MILANVIIPVFMIHGVLWLLLLIPVVFIEAFVLKKMLGLKYGKAVSNSFYANFASTLWGIPIVLGIAYILILTLCYWGEVYFPWSEDGFEQFSNGFFFAKTNSKVEALGFATTLLLLPIYWYISSWIEYYYLKEKIDEDRLVILKKASFRMNAVSYALLAVPLVWFAYNGYSNLIKPKRHLIPVNHRFESSTDPFPN